MSIYLAFSEEPGEQVASNRGWGDFSRWVETLPDAPTTKKLVREGYASPPSAILTEIEEALHVHPPYESVRTTANGLVSMIEAADPLWTFVIVTDGMGRDRPIGNVFCPTGPGGGIDPHCSPGGGGRVSVKERIAAAYVAVKDWVDEVMEGLVDEVDPAVGSRIGQIAAISEKVTGLDHPTAMAVALGVMKLGPVAVEKAKKAMNWVNSNLYEDVAKSIPQPQQPKYVPPKKGGKKKSSKAARPTRNEDSTDAG